MALPVRTTGIVNVARGTDDGGFRQIANSLGAIADDAMDITKQVETSRANRGQRNAQRDFAAAASQAAPGEGVNVGGGDNTGGPFGSSDKAYKNTMALLTLERAKKDSNIMFEELALDTKANPTEFERQSNEIIKGYVEAAPIESRGAIEEELRYKAQKGLLKRVKERRDHDIEEANTQSRVSIENMASDLETMLASDGAAAVGSDEFIRMRSEYEAMQDIRENNPNIIYTAAEREADDRKLDMRLQAAGFSKEIRNIYDEAEVQADTDRMAGKDEHEIISGKQAAYASVEDILDRIDVDPKQKKAMRATMRADVDAAHQADSIKVKQLASARRAEEDKIAADARVAVSRGQYSYSRIDALRETIGDSNWATLTKERDRYLEAEKKKSADASEFEAVISGAQPYDIFNTKQTKALDKNYENVEAAKIFESGDPVKGNIDYIARTGHLPSKLKTSMQGAIMMGEPQDQIVAIEMARAIKDTQPQAYGKFNKPVRDIVGHTQRLMDNGIPAETAIVRARDAIMPQSPMGEARKKELTRSFVTKNMVDAEAMIADEFDGELGEEARLSLRTLWESEYQTVGSELGMETVHQGAIENFKRIYGRSSLGRSPVMKYSPEKMYGVPGMSDKKNAKWIESQYKSMVHDLTKDINDIQISNPTSGLLGDVDLQDEVSRNKLAQSAFLVTDPDAGRDPNGPSYQIFVDPDDDGFPEPLIVEGEPVTYRPDYRTTPEYESGVRKAAKRDRKALEKARARRALMIDIAQKKENDSSALGFSNNF